MGGVSLSSWGLPFHSSAMSFCSWFSGLRTNSEVWGRWTLVFTFYVENKERNWGLRASYLICVFADGKHSVHSSIPRAEADLSPSLVPPSHTCRFSSARLVDNSVNFIRRMLNVGTLLLQIVGVWAERGEAKQRWGKWGFGQDGWGEGAGTRQGNGREYTWGDPHSYKSESQRLTCKEQITLCVGAGTWESCPGRAPKDF